MTEVADYIAGAGPAVRLSPSPRHGGRDARPTSTHSSRDTGASVGLTLDTGHAALGGVDSVDVIRDASRAHRPRALQGCPRRRARRSARATGKSFLDGVLAGMFTVPGDGDLDFAQVMRALTEIGYSGWIIVEAEQDPAHRQSAHVRRAGPRRR